MTPLKIELFDGFHFSYEGEPVSALHQPRLQSLLAYLLLHPQISHPRRRLAFLFWPDSAEGQARTNLRKALFHIRRRLLDADRYLKIDVNTVQWVPDAPFTLDVADFERALDQADAAWQNETPDEAMVHLSEAAALYQGDLLPGCYDDWILAERERLHQRVLAALERLMQRLEETRDYAEAIRYGRRLLALDPLHEAAYRRLMRLHALHGDRADALRVYHLCAELLARELGVSPNADTQEAYAHLLRADAPPVVSAQPKPRVDATRLVGRSAEWRQLQAAWRLTTETTSHFVLVTGEAGIGKSHLVAQMLYWAAQQGITTAHARAYAAEGGLAYAPVVEWLRSEPYQLALVRLDRVWLGETSRLLPELLEAFPDLPRPDPLTERWQRQKFFEALAHAVLQTKPPLLLVLDDLQWCDGETLEWLHFLLRFVRDLNAQKQTRTRLMVIGTVRPEEIDDQHPLTQLRLDLLRVGQITEIELGPLTADETTLLATQAAERTLNSDTCQRLYQASKGNPLFVVEMVRSANWESASEGQPGQTAATDSPSLPPRVQAVIQSRLSQLSPTARTLANLAATIGRAFTFDLLAQAGDVDEDSLVRGLDELWRRRIVVEQDATSVRREFHDENPANLPLAGSVSGYSPGFTTAYDFSHDRIRDVAYAELSPVRRRSFHRNIARALTALHADGLDTVSGQIGFHYEHAQQPQAALVHYRRAADTSSGIFAFGRAFFYLKRISVLLADLPTTMERTRQRIECWLEIAENLIATEGWTSVEYRQALEHAYDLAKGADNPILLFDVQQRLSSYYINTGNHQIRFDLTAECLALAEKMQDQTRLCQAYAFMASSHLQRGEYDASMKYYRRTLDMAEMIGSDYWHISPRSRMVETFWACGYPDQARKRANDHIRTIDAQGAPFGRVHERECTMFVYQRIGDHATTIRLTDEIYALADRFGFPNYALSSRLIRGWLAAQSGNAEEGVRQMVQSLEAMDQIGDRFYRPWFLALLAEAQARSNRLADALDTLAQARSVAQDCGDHAWDAEILRLTGDFRLLLDPTDSQVDNCYRSALAIARQQGARMLELRATVSLARLWQSQDKTMEALDLLAPIYAWFSEGFDTPDLIAAAALLDEIRTKPPL